MNRRSLLLSLGLAALLGAASRLPAAPGTLVLATTTSTQDTGLLDALLPRFEKQSGLKVKVIAVGTGQALAMGRRGDADVLMVHAPEAEKQFVAEGHGIERKDLFYNDFVVVGPAADPAGVGRQKSLSGLMAALAAGAAPFISRGDDSGTHKKEQALWKQAGLQPSGPWYLSAGAGQAEALRMASERGAYVLTDRGSYLALAKTLRLRLLFRGDPALRNPYAVIVVNPAKHPGVNVEGARHFSAYLLAPGTQRLIAAFGKDRFGQPLFRTYR
ncbi:MAG TPA: substrate-binding domain-containing protein [Armatimonadota bacterium]|nr:substrate-binding domain-containing protein [Armatimonadota bacterium]